MQDAGANETILAAAEKELKRLSHIPSASPEYSVIVSYVEMLADLPWKKSTEDSTDLARAQEILDRDHYGLEKVKRRIVEFLAVRKLNPRGTESDPLLYRTSRSWKDEFGSVDRGCAGPEVHAHLLGRDS